MSRRPQGSQGPDEALGGSGGRGVLLLVIAVVLGIIVLQATDNGDAGTDVSAGTTVEQEDGATATSVESAPTTIRALRPAPEVKVLPANGTKTSGLGARVGDVLKANGYTNTLSAVDAASTSIAATVVQYKPDFGPEAQIVATALGLPVSVVKPLDNPPPVRDTRDADVIVLVGDDLVRIVSGATTTTAAG